MEQGPSWEANWFAATQEIPRISRNTKVHYRIIKCPPTFIILSQIDSVHVPRPTSWISILVSFLLRLGIPSGLFPSGFPTKILYISLLSPHTCYIPHTSHYSRFDHPYNIWRGVQIIKLIIMKFSPLPYYLVPLRRCSLYRFYIIVK